MIKINGKDLLPKIKIIALFGVVAIVAYANIYSTIILK